jgi:hypothetical protein
MPNEDNQPVVPEAAGANEAPSVPEPPTPRGPRTPNMLDKASSGPGIFARIQSARDGFRAKCRSVVERATGWVDQKVAFLDEEVEGVETRWQAIKKITRDAVLGIPALGLRAANNSVKVGSDVVAGATGTVGEPVFHPKETAEDLITYAKENPYRAVASLKAGSLGVASETVEGAIGIPTKITQRALSIVPVVGDTLAKGPAAVQWLNTWVRAKVAGAVSWILPDNRIYEPSPA